MGRVRPTFIKKYARLLLEQYPNVWTTSFEQNKKMLGEFATMPSKHVRNRIAGYLVHLVKQKEAKG